MAIPSRVEFHELQVVLDSEVDTGLPARRRQRDLANDFAWFDPRNVLDLARIIETEDAEREGFDGEDFIDEFVSDMVDDKINEGKGGYDHYAFNFGDESAADVAKNNGLIDLDAAAEHAVNVDGVAHTLSRYDGEEHESNGTYWYRQQ